MGSQATYLEVKVEKASSNIFCLDRLSVIELRARDFKSLRPIYGGASENGSTDCTDTRSS